MIYNIIPSEAKSVYIKTYYIRRDENSRLEDVTDNENTIYYVIKECKSRRLECEVQMTW